MGLKIERVKELAKTRGGDLDRVIDWMTATEVRELAKAWLLLDEIDAKIAHVIDPLEIDRRKP